MNYLIISGNPKKNGLCQSITDEVIRGVRDGGAQPTLLTVDRLERCHVCGDGWGSCREKHRCAFGSDGFDEAQTLVKNADQLCFITPVYWGEMAESIKCFFDRLRRCESAVFPDRKDPPPVLLGKQALLIASPGGSGNGALSCLEQMDRFCRHTGAAIFDYISINRWNNDYKKAAVYAAAYSMTQGRKAGERI
jgi:multimeric flavodoxin WrbA